MARKTARVFRYVTPSAADSVMSSKLLSGSRLISVTVHPVRNATFGFEASSTTRSAYSGPVSSSLK